MQLNLTEDQIGHTDKKILENMHKIMRSKSYLNQMKN